MNFDHLDDPTPVEPSGDERATVAARASKVRRRRALVPAVVALVVVAVGLGAIAMVANDDDGAQRVVAGGGKLDVAPPQASPVTTAGTLDGLELELTLPKTVFTPNEVTTANLRVRNPTDEVSSPFSFHVCARSSAGTGVATLCSLSHAGYEPAHGASGAKGSVRIPNAVGTYDVVVQDDDGKVDPKMVPVVITVREPGALIATSHIELDRPTVVIGQPITGALVIDNPRPVPVELRSADCTEWYIVAAPAATGVVIDSSSSDDCPSKPITAAPGTTRIPFQKSTAITAPGQNYVRFLSREPLAGFAPPQPVPVTLVVAAPLTARIEFDHASVAAGQRLHGTFVVENNTDKAVELRDNGSCTPLWQVVLTEPGAEPSRDFILPCGGAPLRFEPGTTRLPFDTPATLRMCAAESTDPTVPHCLSNGGIPPLEPGRYEAVFVWRGTVKGAPTPAPVDVTVTPS